MGVEAEFVIRRTAEMIEIEATTALGNTGSVATEIISTFDNELSRAVRSIDDVINDTNDSIQEGAANTAREVQETFDGVDRYIEEQSIATSMITGEVGSNVINDIESLTLDVSTDIQLLTESMTSDFNQLVRDSQDGIRTDIELTTTALSEVSQQAFLENSKTISEITEITGKALSEVDQLSDTLESGVIPGLQGLGQTMADSWFMQDAETARLKAADSVASLPDPIDVMESIATGTKTIKEVLNDPAIRMTFFGVSLAGLQVAFANILMAIQGASIANTTRVETLLQAMWKSNPIIPFSFSESASLATRGHISNDFGMEESAKTGYSQERFHIAAKANEIPLSIEQSRDALHRKEIGENEFDNYLKRQGYNSIDSDVIRKIVNLRPPIQDLITMSVRDVFSQSIVDQFDLFKELPTRFVNEAQKSGLSREWAEFYWGAHWRLPSANQGFEMFHRGFIDDKELDLLIKALDVSPFWRDKLKLIAFRPITRVDIRRMFKLGVIGVEEVYRRHLDLGYSPDDATKMTEFVVSLIDDQELTDDLDPRLFTQSQIKTLFLQGTLSKDQAIDQLMDADYSSSGAMLLVGSWETDQQIRERSTLLKLVTAKAIREGLEVSQVEQIVSGLELTFNEREIMNREIVLRSSEYPNIPTKAELKSMREAKIIDRTEWVKNMHQHGYNLVWIERYEKLWGL